MTNTHLKRATAGLIAASLGLAALTLPASAGGSISVDIVPTNADSDTAIRTGLGIYSILNDVKNGAGISQNGINNLAGIAQHGSGNVGIVHQDGNDHSGTVQQNGNGNAHGLFQFGENTDANIVQNGNDQTGLTLQWGW